jgi:hypothetical protein
MSERRQGGRADVVDGHVEPAVEQGEDAVAGRGTAAISRADEGSASLAGSGGNIDLAPQPG